MSHCVIFTAVTPGSNDEKEGENGEKSLKPNLGFERVVQRSRIINIILACKSLTVITIFLCILSSVVHATFIESKEQEQEEKHKFYEHLDFVNASFSLIGIKMLMHEGCVVIDEHPHGDWSTNLEKNENSW
jgi:hypothetical protein